MEETAYDRKAAVEYAHRWALGRNSEYYDYEKIGGDCTNFASQCVYAGAGVMNYQRETGWYYKDANNKSPSWTGVEYFYKFITGNSAAQGPYGKETWSGEVEPGDIVQLSFDAKNGFTHSLVIVETGLRAGAGRILVAAHSEDSDYRALDTYSYENVRYLHIVRVMRE